MATETPGADYFCDCGHRSRFSASSIFDVQNESRRKPKPIIVIDSEDEGLEHRIEFHKGTAVAILCPELGRCPIVRKG